MRYLIDARSLTDPKGGGVSRVASGLIKAFIDDHKEDEIVLATTGSVVTHLFASQGVMNHAPTQNVRHIHLKIPNKLWSMSSMIGLVSLDSSVEKRVGKIDAVFLPNLGFVGKMKRPYVLLLHDLSFLIEPRWFPLKTRIWHKAVDAKKLINGASHLLAVSETTKRDAMRLLEIPEQRISVIPIGASSVGARLIAPSDAACTFGAEGVMNRAISSTEGVMNRAPTPKRYVLALGGNDPRKNVGTAIAAVEALRHEKDFSDLELVIVGAPLVGALSDRAGARPAPTWIHHIHRPSDSGLFSLYSNASAFLYPSWYEGYGLPLHEAATHGTLSVASTAGALPETAPEGTIFADPTKPHHWVEGLRAILSEPRNIPIFPNQDSWKRAAKILHNAIDVRHQ